MATRPPPPYTSDPLVLFRSDLWLFLRLSITWPLKNGLPSIILPLRPCDSGQLDELSFTLPNAWACFLHLILFTTQSIFILSIPTSALIGIPFPTLIFTPFLLLTLLTFIICTQLFCYLLNGAPGHTFASGRAYASNPTAPAHEWRPSHPSHTGERWLFINGVAVGSHWLQCNLDRLALTFRRPILGIHNATYGIPFDILQCIAQRTFGYNTLDIRNSYSTITSILSDPSTKKLVLMAHSQGAIELSMVLDYLYATLPASLVGKVEVFTFGNAGNHWNCPMGEDGGRVIRHVEHFVNTRDWVSRFGILAFRLRGRRAAQNTEEEDEKGVVDGMVVKKGTWEIENEKHGSHRFVGRMFLRQASGHQFNQHYLDNIFPMDERMESVLPVGGCKYMGAYVDEMGIERDDVVEVKKRSKDGLRMWQSCRLWSYVNGCVPEDD